MPSRLWSRYATTIFWFCWFELYNPTVKRPWLYGALSALALVITVVHSNGGYVEEFQALFVGMVLVGWVCLLKFCLSPAATRDVKVIAVFYIVTTLVALTAWIIDRDYCDQLASFNPQLHAWWHALVALATYSSVNMVK